MQEDKRIGTNHFIEEFKKKDILLRYSKVVCLSQKTHQIKQFPIQTTHFKYVCNRLKNLLEDKKKTTLLFEAAIQTGIKE